MSRYNRKPFKRFSDPNPSSDHRAEATVLMRSSGILEWNETAMMTPAQYDRLERLARLLCEAAERDGRKSRQQTKKLKRWVAAQKECDAAEQALNERPEDLDRKEILVKARQLLDQARSDLKH